MKFNLLAILLIFGFSSTFSQTKVSGEVFDEFNNSVAFANVIFKGTTIGTITDENGRFYIESEDTYDTLVISFMGYEVLEVPLENRINYDVKLILKESAAELDEILIVGGKQPKKNNPAVDILKKVWENKRRNGVNAFRYYEYDKYEKIEFDLNTIDSALINSKVFKGMEFVFDKVDTSHVTGKTYLPIFINEAISKVYGNNVTNQEKTSLLGNKNSGFSDNQVLIDFIDDLYDEYDVYDNHLRILEQSFVSPLSETGVNVYNYVLSDSAFVDNKWCYNIIYYPRRKNEMTFKGDFWVNDTTYAIKEINLQASKSANINWVKELYIEQEFEVLNDSVFLLKRDYFMSDFTFNKKEESKGVYGKRTTLYNNYVFDDPKEKKFYIKKINEYNPDAYDRSDEFWETNRQEGLNEDEEGIYKMLDTLKTVKKFKQLYNIGNILASNYVEIDALNFDFGPVFSVFGFNEVEGLRVRLGGRTYFTRNDLWRLEGFGAYGFKDQGVKYGIAGKWLVYKDKRIILNGGYRKDIEQIGASLTSSQDALGRSLASNTLIGTSPNDKLTNIELGVFGVGIEPVRNLEFNLGVSYRTLESASDTFSLDYFDPEATNGISSQVQQFESNLAVFYFPGRNVSGYGVERHKIENDFASIFAQVSVGSDNVFNSDFDYTKLQLSYTQPWRVGGIGKLKVSVEAGKTFGEVPLGLLSIISGNQSFFTVFNTFQQLDYYEFVTDTYVSTHLEHNFNGLLFARIPLLRKLNLREIIGVRAAWGEVSQENRDLNASGLIYQAPTDEPYYEFGFGIGNILKLIRIDCHWRGNYLDAPGARGFGVTGSLGFYF
ncbi:MAG: hypothetical protein BM564_08495 [Bacteroidetes bacterium MedPE-SWsnd-G2]|nr:MAG: hypothetical protein BM564_08495 [Bacteroidetes bacterium MedPE-SWsnd-G2]